MEDRTERLERLAEDIQKRLNCLEARHAALTEGVRAIRDDMERMGSKQDRMLAVALTTLLGVVTLLVNLLIQR